jgi:hypothetical protein
LPSCWASCQHLSLSLSWNRRGTRNRRCSPHRSLSLKPTNLRIRILTRSKTCEWNRSQHNNSTQHRTQQRSHHPHHGHNQSQSLNLNLNLNLNPSLTP